MDNNYKTITFSGFLTVNRSNNIRFFISDELSILKKNDLELYNILSNSKNWYRTRLNGLSCFKADLTGLFYGFNNYRTLRSKGVRVKITINRTSGLVMSIYTFLEQYNDSYIAIIL